MIYDRCNLSRLVSYVQITPVESRLLEAINFSLSIRIIQLIPSVQQSHADVEFVLYASQNLAHQIPMG